MTNEHSIPAAPVSMDLARGTAYFILTSEGWSYDHTTHEFVNPSTGERGRLCYGPRFDDDKPTDLYESVWLQTPGRRPTVEDLQNRVSTVGKRIPVWSVEGA